MVFPNVQGEQAFWQDSARSAFIGATAFIAETPELPLTIGEVLRLLTRHDGPKYMIEQVTARRIAQRPYTEATVSALTDYLKGSADLVNNIRKTITAKLSLWFNPRIDAATSASDFDLRALRHSLHAIYVGVTPDNVERLQPLLALFFQQLVDLTVRTLPQFDPKAKHQVLVLLDEFPVLGPMPVLASAFAFVAGYGMRLMLIMQSKAQLRDPALYGPDKAAAILDNCGVEVVFGTKDLTLMKELSERLGYDTVEAHSHSGPRFWRMFRGARLNETASDQRRALLLPQEIGRLRPHEMIVIRPGMFPIRARRIRYYDEKTFSRLVFPPPEVPAIDIPVRMDRGTVPLPTPAEGAAPDAPTPKPEAEAKPKASRTKKAKPAAEAAASAAPASSPPAPAPAMRPFQSEGLMTSVMGTAVDLTEFGLPDGKAKVATIVDATPTVRVPEPLLRHRRRVMPIPARRRPLMALTDRARGMAGLTNTVAPARPDGLHSASAQRPTPQQDRRRLSRLYGRAGGRSPGATTSRSAAASGATTTTISARRSPCVPMRRGSAARGRT